MQILQEDNDTNPNTIINFDEYSNHMRKLWDHLQQIKRETSGNTKYIDELNTQYTSLCQRLQDSRNEYESLAKEQAHWKQRFNEIAHKGEESIVSESLQRLQEILGYNLEVECDSINQKKLITCVYNKNCYVRLVVIEAGLYDLAEIVPEHPNFQSIQNFLRQTQDTAGLLANIRKYFKSCEN